MLTTEILSPRALRVTASGAIVPADIPRVLGEVEAFLATTERVDMLADVQGPITFSPLVFLEEMKHMALLFRMIRALNRIAVIADEHWLRTVAKIESHLIPGVDYQVYERAEADHARRWLLRETDVPHAAP